jgi:hypothetical protein
MSFPTCDVKCVAIPAVHSLSRPYCACKLTIEGYPIARWSRIHTIVEDGKRRKNRRHPQNMLPAFLSTQLPFISYLSFNETVGGKMLFMTTKWNVWLYILPLLTA